MSLELSIIIAIFGCGLLAFSYRARGGIDVAARLLENEDETTHGVREPATGSNRERAVALRIACGSGAVVGVLLRGLVSGWSPIPLVIAGGVGVLGGYLFVSRKEDAARKRRIRQMEFYLPSVMERIVMAVSSGLDIVPALREASYKATDPVSVLLAKVVDLAEHGSSVATAFDVVSHEAGSLSVKHAFVHLGLAHRQGGEIVRPLKELSDATQIAYQEHVEEQIAKLPVKAVLPLVLTFTGLIVCFITVPIMQIGSITKKVAHVSQQ